MPADVSKKSMLSPEPTPLPEKFNRYRSYLTILAEVQLGNLLRERVSASDVVQETFLDAVNDYEKFRGQSDAELVAWLKRILLNTILRLDERHVRAACRDLRKQVSLDRMTDMENSALNLNRALAAAGGLPDEMAAKYESLLLVSDAVASLSADHREVIRLRNFEELPFDDVAARMQRSSGAVRMLWLRALDKLRTHLESMRDV